MLTPTAAWLQACNAHAEPRLLLTIYDGTNTWKALSGYCTQINEPIAITNVSSVGVEIDPLTRAIQTSEIVVDVTDAWIRPIIENYRLKGKRATLTYGFATIAEGDFLACGAGPIGEIAPDGVRDAGVVSISVMDLMSTFADTRIVGTWISKHPLQILYDGTAAVPKPTGEPIGGRSLLSMSGYNSSTWVTESTFDPTDAAYSGSISHWCVSRVTPYDVSQPTSASELINDLCRLLMGSIIPDETGKLAFKRWDPAAVAVDSFTIDDIIPGSFRQEPLDANVVNRVVIKLAGNESDGLQYPERTVEIDDTDSQAAYAYPGQTSRAIVNEFSSSFCPPHDVELYADITDTATTFSVTGEIHGWAGMRGLTTGMTALSDSHGTFYGSVAQHATATISSSRPAYLLLDNVFKVGSETEVVKVTSGASTVPAGLDGNGLVVLVIPYCDFTDPDPSTCWKDEVTWREYTAATVVRNQLGTTGPTGGHKKNGLTGFAGDLQHTQVWDVTCQVDSAIKTLQRFKYGCPIVEFETPCHKMPVQMGDCVTLVYPGFISYAKDGVTTATTWEVVGKELDPMASPPRSKWRLAMNTTQAETADARVFAPERYGDWFQPQAGQGAEEQTRGIVGYGFVVTVVSGRQILIAPGAAASGAMRSGRTTARTVTLPASRDSYVAYDPFTKRLGLSDVANGAAAPSKNARAIWLAKAVTNATDVTSIVDLRETLPYNFDKVKDGATWRKIVDVDTANRAVSNSIAAGAIIEAKLGASAVTEGKIASSAVTEGKIGASAVTEGKLGALAVTAGKIASNAVEESKINAGAVTEGKIGALAVTEGKLGAGAVTEGKIGALAVTAGKLGAGAVTAPKLGAEAVTAPAIAGGAVASVHVTAGDDRHYANGNALLNQWTRDT